ncbi:MAG TPA: 16S rRNA (adenine(1518)-N(6)/adenine(1519)-N(6))-dimethyltransferase RsmA [Pyrinomonadaceae bacterium]|nr:16S rRNA (adenine(1518)-N(6)/adenine(1519)-N(6))-dimethyltransferase RsmA [Pyrinomonadaceae bacterium]
MRGSNNKSSFAKKSLGQNFLIDQNYIRKIVEALNPNETDTIIEIGPGRGAITERLVESSANIIAMELDREFVPMLRERFQSNSNFRIVEGDATKIDFSEAIAETPQSAVRSPQSKVVANLPYYISTAILQRLSEQRECFSSLVLMFQKEVVERITAKPGTSERGFLTVLVENAFDVQHLFDVPPTAFRPAPKVTSAVAILTPKPRTIADEPAFRSLVSKAFAQKRKTILNNLKRDFLMAETALREAQIDPSRRAETLTLAEWIKFTLALSGE